jgi:hypothetical protein
MLGFLLLCCRCRGGHGYGDLGLGLFGRFLLLLIGDEEKVVVSSVLASPVCYRTFCNVVVFLNAFWSS